MDVEILSRIQFAFTISFHYIYPPLSIGLGLVLVIMEGLYLKTGDKRYELMTRFWLKIFALIFGIGVATGIIMEFEFGTNWATYSKYVGDIFGSALAAEGIFAFALESGFLGILLFGWNRVGPKVHFFSTIMVFLGSMFSAIWIVVANSWQQTPAGYHIVGEGMEARAEITDFWAMVFNPSSVERIIHVWIGAFLAGAFLVLSISAWYILKKKFLSLSIPAFRIALVVATVSALGQLVAGHASADGVAKNQPIKLAAMEGHYDSLAKADMYLVGWVQQKDQKTMGLAIPGGLSFLTYQDFSHKIKGLNAYPASDKPKQINAIFQFYHIMVAIGILLIASTLLACWLALFMMHGAIYLAMKTENRLYRKLTILSKNFTIFFVLSFAISTLYTLLYIPHLSDKFRSSALFFLLPLIMILAIANIPRNLKKGNYRFAFLSSSVTIAALLMMVAIEVFPYLLYSPQFPQNSITVENASASAKTMKILLIIALIGTPLVATYTAFVFWTFKGKVKLDEMSY